MARIFNFYTKDDNGIDIDRTWYDSSTVKYSECIDKDNELKTLRVVFNNGTQYEYKGVSVNKYLLFREDLSNGKALNKYIKNEGYEYEKLENVDIQKLEDELNFRVNGGIFVNYDGEKLILKDNKDTIIYEKEVKLDGERLNIICDVLVATGKDIKLISSEEFDAKNDES